MTTCKHCGAEILWAITPAGKMTPLDAGMVTISQLMDLGSVPKIEETHSGHQCHRATCTGGEQQREPENV